MFKPGDVVRRKEACLRDDYWLTAVRGRSRQTNKALSLNGPWEVQWVKDGGEIIRLAGLEDFRFGSQYFELVRTPSKDLRDYL